MIPGNVEAREQHAKNAIFAAVQAGSVEHFLFYSVFGAEHESILFGRQFRAGEKYLEQSGLNWTHLRTISSKKISLVGQTVLNKAVCIWAFAMEA
jgi:uncharacterized protein YbjT (DUF2867 family)